MLAWIRSPWGAVSTATAVTAALGGATLATRTLLKPDTSLSGDHGRVVAATTVVAPAEPPTASSSAAAPTPAPVKEAHNDAPAAAPATDHTPTFDIVRVEPGGDAVVAGRAAPGSEVVLADQGKAVATVKADEAGQFALLPPTLAAGSHFLTLQTQQDGKTVSSAQGVAVAVNGDRASKPMVALLAPDQPTKVLSDGAPVPAVTSAPAVVAPVAIQSVATGGGGALMASGVAAAGRQCKLYLNGAYLADVKAGRDGHWSVKVEKGMRPGRYTVRADEIESNSGKVVGRAEVPFDFPEWPKDVTATGGARPAISPMQTLAAAAVSQSSAAAPASEADAAGSLDPASATIVKNLQTATVIRGDSLWRISRKMLGHGIAYTQIYASNVSQIRDPGLIYPGQVFVVPNRAIE